jgi:uncharacterized membrane protein YphA (DoxX/SURF4 family)
MRQIDVGSARADMWISAWMERHLITVLRTSVGIVFFWFGVLKFFPGLSPAEDLAARTISALSFGLVSPVVSLPVLATWECLIGLGLVTGQFMRLALALMFLQMSGTITPLFLFPHETWVQFPYRRDTGRPVHHQEPRAGERGAGHLRRGARRRAGRGSEDGALRALGGGTLAERVAFRPGHRISAAST